jgi:alpha-1,2-mannosyltransferase
MFEIFHRLRPALETGDWLDRRRLTAYGAILLALEVAAFLFIVAGTHGWIVPLDKPNTTDFVSFYAAGALANQGDAAGAYDTGRHLAAEVAATEPGIKHVIFVYPPVFTLICSFFARLPYLPAFALFEASTLIPCLWVLRRIAVGGNGAVPSWKDFVPLLAFPAVAIDIGIGQNALLTATLFGGATLAVDRRPFAAGLLFGALCYKPHFGLLVPIALIAAWRWRAVAGAAVSALTLAALSGAVLGWDSWQAFIAALTGSHTTYESGQVDFAAFVSSFGAVRLMGGSPALAYTMQGIASVVAAALVALVWRRNLSLPVRAATLASATLVALPLALFYDFMMAGIAMAWLVRAGVRSGFLPWERLLLAVVYITPMLSRGVGSSLHLPVATIACFALLGMCAIRAWREDRLARPLAGAGIPVLATA